jgi:hypothetical protein
VNQNQLSKNKMEQINNTISMISQIYEKFIEYSNEYPNSIVLMKYADLRDKIQSGWIYDNLDEFVATWNEVKIFCRPSRSSARQEMPDDMDFSVPDDIEFRVTRSTADQYYPNTTLSGYDELQGGDNTYGCSYNSYGGNVHVRELRPYSLDDENYPTSIINLSRDMEEGYQRQVSFVDNNDMEEGYQRQVSFVDNNDMEEGYQRQVSFVNNLLEDNNEEFQRQVSFFDNLLQDNHTEMDEGFQRQVSFIENMLGDQTEMSMSELDLGSDDEDDDEMPELMDL